MLQALFVFAVLLISGCAHMPRFEPSTPIEKAASFHEGLLLCNEYRLPQPAERPIALAPYMICLQDVLALHPGGAGTGFIVFSNELTLFYRAMTDARWSPQIALEVEGAIHAVLRALWQGLPIQNRSQFTAQEKEWVLKTFPRTARELRTSDWPTSLQARLDPKLEVLRAALEGLKEGESTATGVSVTQAEKDAQLCKEFLDFSSEVQYLGSLWRDQSDMTDVSPQSPASMAVRERYAQRLIEAGKMLRSLGPKIREAKSAAGFRTIGCKAQKK